MTCLSPYHALWDRPIDPSDGKGKVHTFHKCDSVQSYYRYKHQDLSFNAQEVDIYREENGRTRRVKCIRTPVFLPCSGCVNCKIDRAQQWAIRCCHEASLYTHNSFITLTYNNENLPSDGSLVPEHFDKFIKDVRNKFGSGIRYFACGEYGEKLSRPHFHVLLFGLDFSDKVFYKKSGRRDTYYTSDTLTKLWGKGHCVIGDLSFQSAGYVARYTLKKINGTAAAAHYDTKIPEFIRFSNGGGKSHVKGGIGKPWFDKFGLSDAFPGDFVYLNNRKLSVPRYYFKLLERVDPELYFKIQEIRKEKALAREELNFIVDKAVYDTLDGRVWFREYSNDDFPMSQLETRRFIMEVNAKKLVRVYEVPELLQ